MYELRFINSDAIYGTARWKDVWALEEKGEKDGPLKGRK
jgi:hypothetical protein